MYAIKKWGMEGTHKGEGKESSNSVGK